MELIKWIFFLGLLVQVKSQCAARFYMCGTACYHDTHPCRCGENEVGTRWRDTFGHKDGKVCCVNDWDCFTFDGKSHTLTSLFIYLLHI